jgi:hypothetical protein
MAKKLKIFYGEPPMGYSFIGLWDNEAGAQKWYAAAMKAKDTKPYILTYNPSSGIFTLWVMKRKGEGKMVGKGFR